MIVIRSSIAPQPGIPVMTALTTQQARAIVDAVLAGPRTDPARRIACAVVDAGGHLLAMAREEEAGPLFGEICQMKAFTCIAVARPTKTLRADAQGHERWLDGIRHVALARMGGALIADEGGDLIHDGEGRVLGAVGVSGEAGYHDEHLAVMAIGAIGLVADAG